MKVRIVIAVLLSALLYAPQASAQSPAVFINRLFAQYKTPDPWAKGNDPCSIYCTADFAKLVRIARRKHVIAYDPICQCNKGGGSYMMFAGRTGATQSDYLATMKRLGQPRSGWTLHLRAVRGNWKIYDVLEKRGGKQVSLRQRLSGTGS